MLQNFGGGGATFRCFVTAYDPELDPHGPKTRPGGRPGPWGACYVLRRYMPFSGASKGLILEAFFLHACVTVGLTAC